MECFFGHELGEMQSCLLFDRLRERVLGFGAFGISVYVLKRQNCFQVGSSGGDNGRTFVARNCEWLCQTSS